MEQKTKTIGQYADVSLYESIGKYKVSVETNQASATETYVAKYEAEERFESLETEEDVKEFLRDNGEEVL
jgi:hypothetical protein